MLRKPALVSIALLILVGFFSPESANSMVIDNELKELIADKDEGQLFPVLLVFDDPIRLDFDVLEEFRQSPPQKRRRRVIAALKKKAKKERRAVTHIIRNPQKAAYADDFVHLYFADAIAFSGNVAMIEQLAELEEQGIMYLNKHREMSMGQPPVEPVNPVIAPTDTVWSVKHINADRVWNETGFTGEGIVVGHIDSGVYLAHPDIADQIWTNIGEIPGNGYDDDANGYIDDINGWDFGSDDNNPNDDSASPGHGTHTAGSVAGNGAGGTLTGVAPDAKLLIAKVVNNSGFTTLSTIWEAEQYCLENGAQIITMSMGTKGDAPAAYLRNNRINTLNIRDTGVAMFVAAGNEHFTYNPPLECRMTARVPSPWVGPGVPYSMTGGVITVGATNFMSNTSLLSSSRGPAKWDHIDPWNDWPYEPGPGLIKPDIVAPGQNINSLSIPNGYSGNLWTGTSMACPHVSGIAALMLQKNPSLSPTGIDSLIQLSAQPLGDPGKDNVFGSGMVDALAAVNSTPLLLQPNLFASTVRVDAFGTAVIEAGQINPLAIELINNSCVSDAKNIVATLAVIDNPYVTVVDTMGHYPDISSHGGSGSNFNDTFSVEVSVGAPQGYEFVLLLTVSEESGFERTFDIKWFVGLPEWRTHETGNVYLTVTDQGILGHMTMLGGDGYGMGVTGDVSHLFLGSFWAGIDESYICNRDYTGNGNETYEWVVQSEPTGRVAELDPTLGEQRLRSIFTDSGHANPRGLVVEQISTSFGSGLYEDIVILEYALTNTGSEPMDQLYTGVYCDFDIFDSSSDEGGVDESRRMAYMFEGSGPYMGVVALGTNTIANLTMVSNTQYMYPTLQISDLDKVEHLQGKLSLAASTEPGDWSVLVSSTEYLPAGGGQSLVAYALIYGETLADLQNNADAAVAIYQPISPVDPQIPVSYTRLEQNHPNPFNPTTSIKFSLDQQQTVSLDIYDIGGRKVRTLVNETRAGGDHVVIWDGQDGKGATVSSGLYFYKLTTANKIQTRKMTIVK